jgi:hypothetical protein
MEQGEAGRDDENLTWSGGMSVCLDWAHFFFVVLKNRGLMTIPTLRERPGNDAGE